MKWFKHDSNAGTDAKLRKVRLKYGMQGYGLYWYCLELIAQTVEKHNLTFELEHDAEIIAHDTSIHQDLVEEMMAFMVDIKLFDSVGGRIFCKKMATRTDEYTQKLLKSLDKIPTQSGESQDIVPTQSGESPRKSELIEENRIEENRSNRFIPPTLAEVQEFCQERGNGINAQKFIDFYESANWFRGKTKIKDWKACVRTWEKNQNQKQVNEVWD